MTADDVRLNAQAIEDDDTRAHVLNGIDVLEQAVQDGKLAAGWPDMIDTDSLELQLPCRCVLGQLFERVDVDELVWATSRFRQQERLGYWKGLAVLGGVVAEDPSAYGFDTPQLDFGYEGLTAAWKIALGVPDEASTTWDV